MNNFSKIGFILSIIGGSVGLGNAWKFPTVVAQNGGSAFVLLFLTIIFTLGFAMFLAEFSIGKITRKDLANAYYDLAKNHKKAYKFGGIFMLGGVFVLSFYLVILGWVLKYTFLSLGTLPNGLEQSAALFTKSTQSDFLISFICFSVCALMTLYFVGKGIKSGIEKLNIYAIPLLGVIVISLLIYVCFQDGFLEAFLFLFKPDFGAISLDSLLDALGLGLFIVCLGVGCISAYAAKVDDDTKILSSSVFIIFLNVLIGLLMGLIIFTFAYILNTTPGDGGAGLVFVSLMGLFSQLGLLGNIVAFLLFFSLFIAGITSAVSMIEPFAFYIENEFKIKRKFAMVYIGVIVFILGFLSMASMQDGFSLHLFGMDFFSFLDFLSSNIMLPCGTLFTSIFIGFGANYNKIKDFLEPVLGKNGFLVWFYFVKIICPLVILIILINNFYPLKNFF